MDQTVPGAWLRFWLLGVFRLGAQKSFLVYRFRFLFFFMKIIVIVFVRLDFNLILYGPGDRVARGAEIHHGDKDRNRILDCRHASFLSPVSSSNSAHSCLALPNVLVLTVLEIDTISIS